MAEAGQIYGGMMAEKAGREQAKEIMRGTALEARNQREQLEQFKGEQTLSFLNSGVTLEGSPLQVLEQTERRGTEGISETIRGGARNANQARRAGRDAFMSSVIGATGGAAGKAVGKM